MRFYEVLDISFFVFHTGVIIFILTGWVFRRTRFAHLIVVLLTGLSWFGLGWWYGIGYCPSTDWHWQVREHLGYGQMPVSYLKFVFDTLTGLDVNARAVDIAAFAAFSFVAVVSVVLNWGRHKGKSA